MNRQQAGQGLLFDMTAPVKMGTLQRGRILRDSTCISKDISKNKDLLRLFHKSKEKTP